MIPAKPPGGKCPEDAQRERCQLQCKYNFFQQADLTIHSWELKCLDCGYRETIGYRSDDEDVETDQPDRCPFCTLDQLPTGINPCQR